MCSKVESLRQELDRLKRESYGKGRDCLCKVIVGNSKVLVVNVVF